MNGLTSLLDSLNQWIDFMNGLTQLMDNNTIPKWILPFPRIDILIYLIGCYLYVVHIHNRDYSQFRMENGNDGYCSMYLQSLPQTKRIYSAKNSSLDVSDIAGARPRYIEKPIRERPVFYNKNDDIDKSHSRVLIPTHVHRPDRQLCVDDIHGTRPKANKFVSTRHTDPLNPHYQLPNVVIAPVPDPKFIRDSLAIDDIDGTRVKETFVLKMQRGSKVIEKQPIEHPKKRALRTNNFMMDVSDINDKQPKIKGTRCTDPLQPSYAIQAEEQNYGFIQGSKTRNPKENIRCPDYSLMTRDIPGAVTRVSRKIESSKKEAVEGTEANSLKRGISSKRDTNPLAPKYSFPGHSEVKASTYTRPKTAVQRFDQFIA